MHKLTATQVKNAKPTKKPFKMTDGGGLYLLVNNAGKYWRYDYRFGGKRKTLALGVFPEVSLKEAREAHGDARKKLGKDIDPGQLRKLSKTERREAAENSFETYAWEWFSRQAQPRGNGDKAHWTSGHARTVKSRLVNNILPWIGKRPVNEISAKEVLEVCRRVENRGAIETAHRVKTICSQVFRYCVACGVVESDPCRDLKNALTPTTPNHMATITDPQKVGELMRAIDGYKGNTVTRSALQLAPLVFVRPGELRHAEWVEMDFEQSMWKIPAQKMKGRRDHIVPLSLQAYEILKDIEPLTGHGRYVFPSLRSTDRPMSENTILAALRRMGYEKEEMCGHGFRGMASTLLHELGWSSHLIEFQLAHKEPDSTKAAYNHAEYLPERCKMMQAWADHLDKLKKRPDL